MSELEKIAVAKIQAAATNAVEGISQEMETLVRRHSARGMGGALVHEAKALCLFALSRHGEVITDQFTWVIKESMWISNREINRYVRMAREELEPVLDASESVMKRATDLVQLQRLLPEYLSELAKARDKVWAGVDLSLRGAVAEAKRRKVRGITEGIIDFFAKIIGSGK